MYFTVRLNMCHLVKWLYWNIDVWKCMFKSHEAEINPCNLTDVWFPHWFIFLQFLQLWATLDSRSAFIFFRKKVSNIYHANYFNTETAKNYICFNNTLGVDLTPTQAFLCTLRSWFKVTVGQVWLNKLMEQWVDNQRQTLWVVLI